MSSLGDAFKALRQVILIDENVARLREDVGSLTEEIRRTRDYCAAIDRRVARIEGVMEGYRRGADDALGRLPLA